MSRRSIPLRPQWPRPFVLRAVTRDKDIAVADIAFGYQDYLYRTPIKFGGTVVDRVTLLNVDCVVRTRPGKTAKGFGSMPLGNVWSFPSKTMPYDQTLGAMKELSGADRRDHDDRARESGHPIDLNTLLEPKYLEAAAEVSTELTARRADPQALHPGDGQPVRRRPARRLRQGCTAAAATTPTAPTSWLTTCRHYLGPEFQGEHLDRYVEPRAEAAMPLYHLVGAVDPLVAADVRQRIGDGLPETLPEWIDYNGLTHIKIKLNGDDLDWDVDRVLRVERAAAEAQAKRGVTTLGLLARLQREVPERRVPAGVPAAR